MRFLIELLCRSIFREPVAWKEINTFVIELGMTNKFTEEELWIIRLGGYFSAFVHRNVKRADGTKYITHPLAVAKIIVFEYLVFDIDVILAAIFHDNAEDSGWPWGAIFFVMEKISNDRVPSLVFFLSKHYILSIRKKYFEILGWLRDVRVLIVKFPDRTHNLRTLGYMSKESQKKKLAETRRYFPDLFVIFREELLNEDNLDFLKNVARGESLADRCESIFMEALISAEKRFAKLP